MKLLKRSVALLICLTMVLVMFTGCNKDKGQGTTGGETAVETPSTGGEEKQEEGKKELTGELTFCTSTLMKDQHLQEHLKKQILE